MAGKGFHVVGVDINPKTLELLNAGVSSLHETGVAEVFVNCCSNCEFTDDIGGAVLDTDITFVVVTDAVGLFRQVRPQP